MTADSHSKSATHAIASPSRLIQGMLLLGGGEMAAKIFCFLAFTRIGRLLGPERYGSLEFVMAFIVFFTLPADCGLGSYGAREIAKRRYPGPRLLAGIATLRSLLALASYVALAATTPWVPAGARTLVCIYGLGFLLMPLQLQWLFQGHGKMQWVAAASVVRYGVFAGLVFLLVRDDSTLISIGIFECIALIASSAMCVWVARADLKDTLAELPPRLADLKTHLGRSWPIGMSQVSWVALWYFATVFLGFWVVDASLGQFGAAHRIVMALHTFVWMYFYNLLPTICRTAVATGKDLRALLGPSLALTAWAGGLAALLVTLLSSDIIAIAYGEPYRPAGRLLSILIWAVPVALLSGHYRYALVACDHERLEFRCNAIAAVVAIVLGIVLIPFYGATAAAVALVASAAVVLALAYAATSEAGVLMPSISLTYPAWAALLVSGLVARGLSDFGNWLAAAGAGAVYVTLLSLYEFRRLVGWRVRSVDSSP
jgi:O-antigen/teichoic acid export membrane protein